MDRQSVSSMHLNIKVVLEINRNYDVLNVRSRNPNKVRGRNRKLAPLKIVREWILAYDVFSTCELNSIYRSGGARNRTHKCFEP